jgi:hypothetical protein
VRTTMAGGWNPPEETTMLIRRRLGLFKLVLVSLALMTAACSSKTASGGAASTLANTGSTGNTGTASTAPPLRPSQPQARWAAISLA